jgi:hypothetical protein
MRTEITNPLPPIQHLDKTQAGRDGFGVIARFGIEGQLLNRAARRSEVSEFTAGKVDSADEVESAKSSRGNSEQRLDIYLHLAFSRVST